MPKPFVEFPPRRIIRLRVGTRNTSPVTFILEPARSIVYEFPVCFRFFLPAHLRMPAVGSAFADHKNDVWENSLARFERAPDMVVSRFFVVVDSVRK